MAGLTFTTVRIASLMIEHSLLSWSDVGVVGQLMDRTSLILIVAPTAVGFKIKVGTMTQLAAKELLGSFCSS